MTDLTTLLDRSVALIRQHQAASGAYLASPTFPPYRYSWFRDGSFIADAVSRVGQPDSAERFFDWCSGVIAARRDHIETLIAQHAAGQPVLPDAHLHTRYTASGDEVDEPWWTFQLDGYGTWLWALVTHQRRHDVDLTAYLDAVALTVRYLAAFWNEPCYDWWEEHREQRHTSTLGAVAAGLEAAATVDGLDPQLRAVAATTAGDIRDLVAREAVLDGHLTKWLGTEAVDASLVACIVPFGLHDVHDPVARATVARVEAQLAPAGVYRYLHDVYYGGGQWVLLAGFLGWYHAQAGNRDRAEELLAWMAAQADGNGDLPEQVSQSLLHPEHERPWIERWGAVAKPLLWSHAMLLTLADALGHVPAAAPAVVEERR